MIKVEARRVTRNASRYDGSFKTLIFQIDLGFAISLINDWHFIDVDPVKHIRSSLFAKTLNGLMSIYYFLKILNNKCLTGMQIRFFLLIRRSCIFKIFSICSCIIKTEAVRGRSSLNVYSTFLKYKDR